MTPIPTVMTPEMTVTLAAIRMIGSMATALRVSAT